MPTILFVDDDEMERYFIRELLEPRGHRVLYAGDGETALRIFDRESVDVIVTDLAMPRLNGLRLIKRIRELDRYVPIIAASGINADQLDMAEDLGAVAILQKPWDPRGFLTLIHRLAHLEENDETFEDVWPTLWGEFTSDTGEGVEGEAGPGEKAAPVEGLFTGSAIPPGATPEEVEGLPMGSTVPEAAEAAPKPEPDASPAPDALPVIPPASLEDGDDTAVDAGDFVIEIDTDDEEDR